MVHSKALSSHRERPPWHIRLSFVHFPLSTRPLQWQISFPLCMGCYHPSYLISLKSAMAELTKLHFMSLWKQRKDPVLWFQVVWLVLTNSLVLHCDFQDGWMDGHTFHSEYFLHFTESYLWINPDYPQIPMASEESLGSSWGKEQCFSTTLNKFIFSWKRLF